MWESTKWQPNTKLWAFSSLQEDEGGREVREKVGGAFDVTSLTQTVDSEKPKCVEVKIVGK